MIPCDLTVNGQSCPFPAAWLYDLDDLGRVLVCERHEPTFGFPEGKRAKLENGLKVHPQRVMLRRAAGWRKPEGAVVVARPSKWGNPFPVAKAIELGHTTASDAHALVVQVFREWLDGTWGFLDTPEGRVRRERILTDLHELRGHDLACWCPVGVVPCHGDYLLELANS